MFLVSDMSGIRMMGEATKCRPRDLDCPTQADSLGTHHIAHHPTSLFETFDSVKMISLSAKALL